MVVDGNEVFSIGHWRLSIIALPQQLSKVDRQSGDARRRQQGLRLFEPSIARQVLPVEGKNLRLAGRSCVVERRGSGRRDGRPRQLIRRGRREPILRALAGYA